MIVSFAKKKNYLFFVVVLFICFFAFFPTEDNITTGTYIEDSVDTTAIY